MAGLAFVVVISSICAAIATAQAVRPEISAAHPVPDVTVAAGEWLDADRPRIAIHLPRIPRTDVSGVRAARIRDAVTDWELLLLGLDIPYTVIDDDALENGPGRDIHVLIMPAAARAGRVQLQAASRFVRNGGGLIASGVPSGDPAAVSVLEELLGARFEPVSPTVSGAYQILFRAPEIAAGNPAGFRLNIAVRDGFAAARVVPRSAVPVAAGTPLGVMQAYGAGPEGDLTAALSSRAGDGRVVWTGFAPQDVSDEPDQQLAWQRFALGALAATGGRATVSIEAWPDGSPAALAVAVIPSPGSDPASMLANTGFLLDVLEREAVPATFFISGSELALFPDLAARISDAGEFGVTTRSERPMSGQSPDVQRARILEGTGDLRTAVSLTAQADVRGFMPPGALYDGSTIRALKDEKFDYILAPPVYSLMPDSAAIHEAVDYRSAESRDRMATIPLAASGRGSLDAEYRSTVRAGGLFVLPYRVEEIAPGSVRFDTFEHVIETSRSEGVALLSLSEVAEWTAMRRDIRVEIGQADGRGTTLVVRNTGNSPVRGIVLRWSPGPDARSSAVTVSDVRISAEIDRVSDTVLLGLPELPADSMLEFRIEHR